MLSQTLRTCGRRLRSVSLSQKAARPAATCQLHGSTVQTWHKLIGAPPPFQHQQCRHIWGWLNAIFNKVDASRIDAVGADRACAEWLLRCGAAFRWRSQPGWQTDYNALQPHMGKKLFIEEINADNAAIMHIGFHHLSGLTAVRKIRFHYCGYLDDTALRHLEYLAHSLESLEISSCGNVTRQGLRHLAPLTNLRELKLYDLPEIEQREECVQELKTMLPECDITFPPAETKKRK